MIKSSNNNKNSTAVLCNYSNASLKLMKNQDTRQQHSDNRTYNKIKKYYRVLCTGSPQYNINRG